MSLVMEHSTYSDLTLHSDSGQEERWFDRVPEERIADHVRQRAAESERDSRQYFRFEAQSGESATGPFSSSGRVPPFWFTTLTCDQIHITVKKCVGFFFIVK